MKNKNFILVFLILMLAMTQLFAGNNTIYNIIIKGNVNIDEELILSSISFNLGDELNSKTSAESIKNLYKLGVFKNIQLKKKELSQGIEVILDIEEYPVVNEIKFKGEDEISEKKLTKIMTLRKGNYWSPFLAKENSRLILEKYKEEGYHLAEVEFEEVVLKNNQSNVLIKIDEGDEVRIKKIKILGNKIIEDKKILGVMKSHKKSLFHSGKLDKEKLDLDLQKIISYYNKEGFIEARIISDEIITDSEGQLIIKIYLKEGENFRFKSLKITGNQKFTDDVLLSYFDFQEGEKFNQEKFNKQMNNIASLYYEEGYMYANFDQQLVKDGSSLNVVINISENTRAKIRNVIIKGNKKTKEKIIRRNLAISPGDYFKQSKIMQSQRNIYNLGFFEPNIKIDYQPINNNGDIDLYFIVEDKSSGTANGGVGYNSKDSFVGQLSIANQNLFGNAWKIQSKWEFGGSTQNFSSSFTNPYYRDSNTLVGTDIYYTKKDWDDDNFSVFKRGAGLRVGRPVSFLNYSKVVAGYSFYMKKYEIINENFSTITSVEELAEKDWEKTSTFSLTFTRDSRDNIYYPTTGSKFVVYSEIAGGPFMGDSHFFKQISEVSWYNRIFWKLVLQTKWRYGYITSIGSSNEIPPEEKFKLGGTGVDGIRGYADNSIGPSGGGNREIIHISELKCPFGTDQIWGMLFYDAGNSFDKLEKFNFWDFESGAGLGIRVRSPMGLIGFDYAYNFRDNNWEPHFQFGTNF